MAKTAEIINNSMNEKNTINIDELYDEVELAKQFWNGKLDNWKKKKDS